MEAQLKNILRYGYAFMITGIFMSSCQKIESDITGVEKPVVQGYLASGHTAEVKVYSQLLFANADTSKAVGGQNIALSVDGQTYPMTQFDTVYRSPLVIREGKVYSVAFTYNGKDISSTTTIPARPSNFKISASSYIIPQYTGGNLPTLPDPITLTWSNPDQSYYLVLVKNIETNPTAINTGIVNRRIFFFRSNPLQSDTYDIRAVQFQHYGRHQIILYKINSEYAELYQNNGTSSLNIKTPYSNITNGLGIFTGINADTVMVNVTSK